MDLRIAWFAGGVLVKLVSKRCLWCMVTWTGGYYAYVFFERYKYIQHYNIGYAHRAREVSKSQKSGIDGRLAGAMIMTLPYGLSEESPSSQYPEVMMVLRPSANSTSVGLIPVYKPTILTSSPRPIRPTLKTETSSRTGKLCMESACFSLL